MDAAMIDSLIDKAATALGGGTLVTLAAYVLHKIKKFPFKMVFGQEDQQERRRTPCITKKDLESHCKVIHDKANIIQEQEAKKIDEIHSGQKSIITEMVEIKDKLMDKIYDHEGRIGALEGSRRKAA